MDADLRELGEAIRSARMRKGLTQEALAEMLDITPIHLKNMESSRRKPSVPMLFALMELLDFSADALVFPERSASHRQVYSRWNGLHSATILFQAHTSVRSSPQESSSTLSPLSSFLWQDRKG